MEKWEVDFWSNPVPHSWLDAHRREAFITCEETCACWWVSEKIEKALEVLET